MVGHCAGCGIKFVENIHFSCAVNGCHLLHFKKMIEFRDFRICCVVNQNILSCPYSPHKYMSDFSILAKVKILQQYTIVPQLDKCMKNLNVWYFRGSFCIEYSHFCSPEKTGILDIYPVVIL